MRFITGNCLKGANTGEELDRVPKPVAALAVEASGRVVLPSSIERVKPHVFGLDQRMLPSYEATRAPFESADFD
jgi:hypothetical protein